MDNSNGNSSNSTSIARNNEGNDNAGGGGTMNTGDANTGHILGFEEGWQQIQDKAISKLEAILDEGITTKTKPFPPREYAPIYTIAYNMCTQRAPHNWSEELYQRHGKTISDYLTQKVLPALRNKHDQYLLMELDERWQRHKIMNKWMKKFFMYLDRYYVKHHSLPLLHDAGLKAFETQVFDQVKQDVTTAMLGLVERDRSGEDIDAELMRKVVAIYQAMQPKNEVYVKDFETRFLEDSANYYRKKAQLWNETDSVPSYLIKAENALTKEAQRVDRYLVPSTKPKIEEVCVEQLLTTQQTQLLEKEGSGCRALLRDDKKSDLQRMFQLFSRVEGGLPPMAKHVKDHITAMGMQVIQRRQAAIADAKEQKESSSDPTFVNELLDLHEKFRELVANEFEGHSLFRKAMKDAFEEFVNQDAGTISNAEMISAFSDRILKSGAEKLSEDQIEDYLERIVQLFSYLSDKDLFSEIYRNALAKRLLNGRSASNDAERSMIAKLKLRCGAQFTSKLEGMVNDLNMGEDAKRNFRSWLKGDNSVISQAAPSTIPATSISTSGNTASDEASSASATEKQTGKSTDKPSDNESRKLATENDRKIASELKTKANVSSEGLVDGVEFEVEVLTTGHWPSYKLLDLHLPREMQTCVELFEGYYRSIHESRKLKWVYSLGNALLRANFKKTYELQITTLQAVTLLNFNDVEGFVNFPDIVKRLNSDDETIKRVLHSLSCGKHKVLQKEPKSKGISKSDKFQVNPSFASPMRRIRIPMASLEESHNPKRVEEDRTIAIEAAIVRIMKARKRLEHVNLISEVLSQLHFFRPDPKSVKKRIEALIDREYLERDEEDSNVYKYLA